MCITKAVVSRYLLKHAARSGEDRELWLYRGCAAKAHLHQSPLHRPNVRWATTATSRFRDNAVPVFKPKRVVVLTKMTRYEYERRLHSKLSEREFRTFVSCWRSWLLLGLGGGGGGGEGGSTSFRHKSSKLVNKTAFQSSENRTACNETNIKVEVSQALRQ